MTKPLQESSDHYDIDALRRRIAELEAENRRLRAIDASSAPPDLHEHIFTIIPKYAQAAIVVTESMPLVQPGPRVVYANPSFERLTHIPAAQAINRPLSAVFDTAIAAEVLYYMRRLHAEGKPIRTEFAPVQHDGTPAIFDLEIVPVKGDDRSLAWIIVYLRNLTMQRRIEHERDALLASLARTNQLLSAKLAEYQRTERNLHYLNQHLEQQILERTAQLRAAVAELAAEVKARRQIAAELQHSQALLRGFIDHVPAVVAVQDSEGRFILANHQVLERLNCSSHEQILGHTLDELGFSDLAIPNRYYIQQACQLGRCITYDFTDQPRNKVWFVSTFPIRNDTGEIIAIGHIAIDITERRRHEEARLALERRLQEAQRHASLGILAGGLAHDFNNMLTAIGGHADLLLLDLPPDSPLREHVEAILHGVRQANHLTAQMLAFAGRGRLALAPVDLNDLVHQVVALLDPALRRCAALHLELADDVPLIEGDATQLRQVLLNLLVNAVDAIGAGPGQITVSTASETLDRARLDGLILGAELAPGRYVRLSVADTGCGMDAATQAQMFEPFFSTKAGGRGLGLATTHGIIRSHRGALEVQSAPGQGTTIHVYLPVHSDPPQT